MGNSHVISLIINSVRASFVLFSFFVVCYRWHIDLYCAPLFLYFYITRWETS